jgi:hypothetical protein
MGEGDKVSKKSHFVYIDKSFSQKPTNHFKPFEMTVQTSCFAVAKYQLESDLPVF